MHTKKSIKQVLGILAVALASVLLLVYVAYGEISRTNARFQTIRMTAQGEIIQNQIESHLRAGLPLDQFVGFKILAADLKKADALLRSVRITDNAAMALFDSDQLNPSDFKVELPLRSKFETVGALTLSIDGDTNSQALSPYLYMLIASAVVIALVLTWFLLKRLDDENPEGAQQKILLLGLSFQTLLIVFLMLGIYSYGAKSTASMLSTSLTTRIASVFDNQLVFDDLTEIPEMLDDYRKRNPSISSIQVRIDQQLKYQSVGSEEIHLGLEDDILIESAINHPSGQALSVGLTLPRSVVYMAIARNLKNFAALFIASNLLAILFLKLLNSFEVKNGKAVSAADHSTHESAKASSLLFLAVFADNLTASFLPQLIKNLAVQEDLPPYAVSMAFMSYFFCFASVLLPADRYAAAKDPRRLLWLGASLMCLGALTLLTFDAYAACVASRALSGAGQGMVFIAVQSLLLRWTSKNGTLGANSSIVYQFNAGMICGLALGSLMVLYVNTSGVFIIVATTALIILALCSVLTTPATLSTASAVAAKPRPASYLQFWKDKTFSLPALLVGIPSKAVMTGVVVYALPLLLTQMAFEKEEIGQMLMFYAVGVLLVNQVLAKRSKKPEALSRSVGFAMLSSGFAVASIGGLGLIYSLYPEAYLAVAIGVVFTVLIIGFCHGAINAPVVTLVANSDAAHQYGAAPVASYYRFSERVGHVLGPLLVGQVLLFGGGKTEGLLYIGAALILLALIFAVLQNNRTDSPVLAVDEQ